MLPRFRLPVLFAALLLLPVGATQGQRASLLPSISLQREAPVIAPETLLTTPVGGLERTGAKAEIVAVSGQPFAKALRVVIARDAAETNATQLTLNTTAPVERGDTLIATLYARGAGGKPGVPARLTFLFEQNVAPWTKSVTQTIATPKDANAWRRVILPFTAAESYPAGGAMVSLRFALQPQTLEVGGLSVVNAGKGKTAEEVRALAATMNPLGKATVAVNLKALRQTLEGFGGNFAQGRYGSSEMIDPVGRVTLERLNVRHARIGLPLDAWAPQPGAYRDSGPPRGVLLLMQEMARRKIPMTASIWEAPGWMVDDPNRGDGKILLPERYADAVEAIAQFLVTARDKYGATVDTVSFNEPDYGVAIKFTPAQMADFIRQSAPRFRELGLKTQWLVGDTANGQNLAAYARPLLEDKTLAPYLGPIAFHNWDALDAPDERYAAIAALGKEFRKPVWCLEAGHDAQYWRVQPAPWGSWDNALRLAQSYIKTLDLTGAVIMDYWTYQDNYPLTSRDGRQLYPAFHILQQITELFPQGAKIATTRAEQEGVSARAARTPAGGFSLLLANSLGDGQVTLTGLPPRAELFLLVRNDATGTRMEGGRPRRVGADGALTLSLPARSVVALRGSRR